MNVVGGTMGAAARRRRSAADAPARTAPGVARPARPVARPMFTAGEIELFVMALEDDIIGADDFGRAR